MASSLEFAKALRDEMPVSILGAGPQSCQNDVDGVRVAVFHGSRDRGFRLVRSDELMSSLRRMLNPSTVLHINVGPSNLLLKATAIARRANAPTILQTHGMFSTQSGWKAPLAVAMLRRAARSAQLLASSAQEAQELRRRAPSAASIEIAPPLAPKLVGDWVPHNQKLLFVGRLHSVKRPVLAVEVLSSLVRRGWPSTLEVVGPNQGQANAVRHAARDNQVEDRVFILGPLPRNEIWRRFCGQGYTFVGTSVSESLGFAMLEALAAGLNCVVTDGYEAGRSLEQAGAVQVSIAWPAEMATKIERIWQSKTQGYSEIHRAQAWLVRQRREACERYLELLRSVL